MKDVILLLRLFTASTPPNAPPIIIRRNLIAVETVNTFPPVEKAEINTQSKQNQSAE